MTPASFWISVDAISIVLEDDSTIDAIEADMREMASSQRAEKLNEMAKIVAQLSRLEIRFKAGVGDRITTVRSGRQQTITTTAHRA